VKVYAGFDCSTQGMAVVAIDATARTVAFRDSLEFETPFIAGSDPGVVHASPRMWSEALETMLGRLASQIDPTTLAAISGSAQQHGSVYCGNRPGDLTRETSPIWMDGSTLRECEEIEAALGGAAVVARLTGSRAYPRFTGPQIRKFSRESPGAYERTRRIHLVSSYLASWLAGDHAPIDHADGSGMNLMDLRSRTWSRAALDATAPGLAGKLPPLVPSRQVVGALHERWQLRFGLPGVPVVAWSGDNPCSLVGTGVVHERQVAISLGTSDTIFGPMGEPRVSSDGTGHVFASPTGGYMGITVFRNGSLARERLRDEFEMDWAAFSNALRATPAGNDGAMMLPWFEPEITPLVEHPSPVRVGLDDAAPERHVRAIVEAQMMALARHSEWMGATPRAIHATGGASANSEILQVMADVFDAEVYRFDSTNSAALGATLRAWQAHTGLGWAEVVRDFVTSLSQVIKPIEQNVRVYQTLKGRYGELEARVLRQ
jgi:xylulokinase